MSVFYVGMVWECEGTIFRPKTKENVDPSEVSFLITRPDGTTEPVAATKLATGVYEGLVDLTAPGRWHAVLTGTGGFQTSKPTSITVYPD